jgi:hypothetical protein
MPSSLSIIAVCGVLLALVVHTIIHVYAARYRAEDLRIRREAQRDLREIKALLTVWAETWTDPEVRARLVSALMMLSSKVEETQGSQGRLP